MSPSEDTTKALLAALESINLEQTARDDAPSAASPKEHADAISVASQTNEPEPVEQVSCLSQVCDGTSDLQSP